MGMLSFPGHCLVGPSSTPPSLGGCWDSGKYQDTAPGVGKCSLRYGKLKLVFPDSRHVVATRKLHGEVGNKGLGVHGPSKRPGSLGALRLRTASSLEMGMESLA